jgi:ribose-phosphate pyrophosphokinase
MNSDAIALFTLQAGRPYGERVAQRLGISLAAHEEREFEWGHHKTRPLESVRGKDVYVVQSLHGDPRHSVNDRLCRLLFFLGALRDASSDRVTAVVPFLSYSRKDARTKSRDPVITRYVAGFFESVGVDRVVTLEVHNVAAFQNAFRCQTEHLEAHGLFADYFASLANDGPLVVASPDVGGTKRAARYRRALERRLGRELPGAFLEKERSQDIVSGHRVVGNVSGCTVLLIDDMISGGTTIARAADACRNAGATRVIAAAAHGVFVPETSRVLAKAPIDRIAILDHIPHLELVPGLEHVPLDIVDGSSLVAEAIRRMHTGGSLVELFDR